MATKKEFRQFSPWGRTMIYVPGNGMCVCGTDFHGSEADGWTKAGICGVMERCFDEEVETRRVTERTLVHFDASMVI